MSDDLQRLLQDLGSRSKQAAIGDALLAHPIDGRSGHYIALDNDAAPVLLLQSSSAQTEVVPPLRLRGIEVIYGVPCRLVLPDGGTSEQVLTTIRCTTSDQLERSFFVGSCATLLRIVGRAPSLNLVISATQHLANVFQRLASPARESVTGVIGELLIIDISPNPSVAIGAWRRHPEDRFDFSLDNIRLEVKSSSSRSRIHHLTYEQCAPPDGAAGILASVTVESAGGGQSLLELIESIAARVSADAEALLRLHEVVADTLGDTLVASLTERFDRALAEDSIALFDLRAIPAIRDQVPRGVTQVRFRSDVSLASTVAASDYVAKFPRVRDLLTT